MSKTFPSRVLPYSSSAQRSYRPGQKMLSCMRCGYRFYVGIYALPHTHRHTCVCVAASSTLTLLNCSLVHDLLTSLAVRRLSPAAIPELNSHIHTHSHTFVVQRCMCTCSKHMYICDHHRTCAHTQTQARDMSRVFLAQGPTHCHMDQKDLCICAS